MFANYLLFEKSAKHAIIFFLLSIMSVCAWSQNKNQELSLFPIIDTARKVDIIDVVKSNFQFTPKTLKRSTGKKVYFSLLPVSIPRGGKAVITSTSAGFFLGKRQNTFYPTLLSLLTLTSKGATHWPFAQIYIHPKTSGTYKVIRGFPYIPNTFMVQKEMLIKMKNY
jgi:hypothetical protein